MKTESIPTIQCQPDKNDVTMSFACPWGCRSSSRRNSKPHRHTHGITTNHEPHHRVGHCDAPGAPGEYFIQLENP